MILPLKDCEITSQYGIIRKDGKLHKGIDLISKSGDRNVKAIRGGIVSYAGYDNTGFGNYVVILQEDGFKALYCHLKSYSVEENDIVKEGQIIGIEGMSGNSTGVDLHLEIRKAPHGREDHINVAEYLGILNEVGKVVYILKYEELEYLGILDFLRKGYKGKGITIASREEMSKHGSNVYDIIKQVCGEANIRINVEYDKDDDWDIYTTSLFFPSDKFERKQICIKELNEKNKILFCAAGNSGDENCTPSSIAGMLSIGACKLINGEPKLATYSSRCEHLDFVSFSGIDTQYDKNINGTSFSSPLFAGMVALIQSYFLQVIGRKLTYKELIECLIENCIDMGVEGRDDNYGYGLFVLPKPWEIDINKYLVEEEEEMPRYNTIEEVPEWGRATIEKLMNLEVLKGDENGNLNLSYDLLRTLVIHDRLGFYD